VLSLSPPPQGAYKAHGGGTLDLWMRQTFSVKQATTLAATFQLAAVAAVPYLRLVLPTQSRAPQPALHSLIRTRHGTLVCLTLDILGRFLGLRGDLGALKGEPLARETALPKTEVEYLCELSFGGNNQREGSRQELPARVLQRCLLTLFRHPLSALLPNSPTW
jgi:hypothetical protein